MCENLVVRLQFLEKETFLKTKTSPVLPVSFACWIFPNLSAPSVIDPWYLYSELDHKVFLFFISEYKEEVTSHRLLTNKAWNCPWFTQNLRFGRIFILDQLFLSDSLPNNFVKIWLVLEPNFENPIVREFWKLSQVFAARSNYICKFWHSVALPGIESHSPACKAKTVFIIVIF